MFNFLTELDPESRADNLCAYREYLLERDGQCDPVARTLSRREALMLRFECGRPLASLDAELFARQFVKYDAALHSSQEMLLLLTLCKLNAAEAYGVNATFHIAMSRVRANADNDTELFVLLEEHYHTRILMSAAREYGIEVAGVFLPPLSLRGLISGLTSVPLDVSRPLVLASELVGTLIFAQAFVRAGEVLADKPELRDRIQERIVEILIDEIGHVSFNQMQLGSWGMFNARRLFPVVALGMRNQAGEWRELGLNTSTDLHWLARVPEEVSRRAFFVRGGARSRGKPAARLSAAE